MYINIYNTNYNNKIIDKNDPIENMQNLKIFRVKLEF